jgi:hypothetical protein
MQWLHLEMVKLLVYSISLLISSTSLAAAWLQAANESELITQYETKTLTTYYTDPATNNNTNSRVFSFDIYSIFYQYGLNKDLTLGFKTSWYNYKGFKGDNYSKNNYTNDSLLLKNAPSEEYVFFSENKIMLDDHYRQSENKPSDTNFFAQSELWSNDNSILSIQPSIQFYNVNFDKALELRLLYGYNFQLLEDQYSYINIETAANRRTKEFFVEDINNTTINLDLTFGLKLTKKNTIMFQSFYQYNGGSTLEENIGQVSLVFQYNQYVTWQTGYSTNLINRKQYISDSVITGLWLKF